MPTDTERIQELAEEEYKYGFYTDVETDSLPPGLDEGVRDQPLQRRLGQAGPLASEERQGVLMGEGAGRNVRLRGHVSLEAACAYLGHLRPHVHQYQMAQPLPVVTGVGHGAARAQGEAG